jgi:hypothetical protein
VTANTNVAAARHRGPIGGSANAAGAEYGASVVAWAACRVLLGSWASIPWGLGDGACLNALSSECDEEVDDLRLDIAPVGTVYIQIKHGLKMGTEFDKGIAQLARQFATSQLGPADRLVLVTDGTASTSIRTAVPRALRWFRDLPDATPLASFPCGDQPRAALQRIQRVFDAEYLECTGQKPTEDRWRKFLAITHLTELDTLDEGRDQLASLDALKRISTMGTGLTWTRLNNLALQGSRLRRPLDAAAIRSDLSRNGIQLNLNEAGSYAMVESCVRHLTRSRILDLERRGHYVRENYVERRALAKQLEDHAPAKGEIVVVAGASGNGKTTWTAWQCESTQTPLRLLLPGESIRDEDLHLRETVHRLINGVASEIADQSYTQAELRRWLKSTQLEVFVDGLDRAVVSSRKLASWLEKTASDIHDFDWRLIVTTRPEIKGYVEQALGPGVIVIEVGGYSDAEAQEAARRLGESALARYRNPRMMFFCARLLTTHGPSAFRHEQAVERFLAASVIRAAGDSDLLPDIVEAALADLSVALAMSETGVLSISNSRVFRVAHAVAYEALRNENILISAQGALRVDIDEIAEHLAGRQTEIAVQISRWNEIRAIPLKAGALRAALEQLAATSPADAAQHVSELASTNVLTDDPVVVSLLCAVISALDDPSPMKDTAIALLNTWKKANFLAAWGTGFDLLNLADMVLWKQADRVELLWLLAPMEHGLDWRNKHWVKPHVYSSYHVTPWRRRFLNAILQASAAGWSFLQKHFDSSAELLGSNEAKLGDLAQGAFVSTAQPDLAVALDFADRMPDHHMRSNLMTWLAIRYPFPLCELFVSEKTILSSDRMVEMARAMRNDDWSPHPATAQLAAHWLDRPEFSSHRRTLLRLVAVAGNAEAACELLNFDHLDSTEVPAIFALHAEQFVQALAALLSSPGDLGAVFDGLSQDQMNVEHVGLISSQMLRLTINSDLEPKLASLCEYMLYPCLAAGSYPPEILLLARRILELPSARARSFLIYPASSAREPDASKNDLQEQLLRLIAELETDLENLNTLCFKLNQNYSDSSEMKAYCEELARRHPGLDSDTGPKRGFTNLD